MIPASFLPQGLHPSCQCHVPPCCLGTPLLKSHFPKAPPDLRMERPPFCSASCIPLGSSAHNCSHCTYAHGQYLPQPAMSPDRLCGSLFMNPRRAGARREAGPVGDLLVWSWARFSQSKESREEGKSVCPVPFAGFLVRPSRVGEVGGRDCSPEFSKQAQTVPEGSGLPWSRR